MAYITPEQAVQRFIPKRRIGQAAPSHQIIRFDRTIGDKGLLYVIRNETSGVSYLTPADDAFVPVLGRWDSTEPIEEFPPAFMDLIGLYEKEINWIRNNEESAGISDDEEAGGINDPSSTFLISTKWAQQWPYNAKMPTFTYVYDGNTYNSAHHLTGCAATALSQILYYWWQKGYYRGCKAIPSWKVSEGTHSGTFNINIPNTERFNYDVMEPYYKTKPARSENVPLNESENAVAILMACMAVACKSYFKDVNNSGRGTYAYSGNSGIKAGIESVYFDAQYKSKEKLENHRTRIINNIKDGIPCILMLGSDALVSSHYFIVDGYDADTNLFHFNFGWDTKNTLGWFPLTAINPNKHDIPINYVPVSYFYAPKPSFKLGDLDNDGIISEKDFYALLQDIDNAKKGIQVTDINRKNLDYDSNNQITDSDIEVLAKHTLLYDMGTASNDTIIAASLMDIRKSLRSITDKLSQLSN